MHGYSIIVAFYNQIYLWLAHVWFPEITYADVPHVCVHVCLCVYASEVVNEMK